MQDWDSLRKYMKRNCIYEADDREEGGAEEVMEGLPYECFPPEADWGLSV